MSHCIHVLVVGLQLIKRRAAWTRQHLIEHRAHRFHIYLHHTTETRP